MFVPSRTLCLTLKAANGDIWFLWQRETGAERVAMAIKRAKGVILFFLWCTFVVPSVKNTALIFPEIFFFSVLSLFSCTPNDVIAELICIIEKCQYLWNEKRYFKKKNAILLYFKRSRSIQYIKLIFIGRVNHTMNFQYSELIYL